MPEAMPLSRFVDAVEFIKHASSAATKDDINALLARLPIVSEHDYSYSKDSPLEGWQDGKLHWLPVGRDRGNAGRVKQANHPINPIAERTVNGMEALIELARQRELLSDSLAPAPTSPREAVKRYFGIPPLDELPKLGRSPQEQAIRKAARKMAEQLRVSLSFHKATKEFSVSIHDVGIGQTPANIHRTLLSLGATTKAEYYYLIGVFGQGGSSAFAVSDYSWIMSRRAPDLLHGSVDGVGWTVVKHVFPKGRRDDYFAYLASSPEGHVPFATAAEADLADIQHGTRFMHIGYNFGSGGSAITRQLYPALNHVLYNPVLPYELSVGGTDTPMYGNGYRLSNIGRTKGSALPALDKLFPSQRVGA